MSKVAILIPCYNEELTIAKVVKEAFEAMPEAEVYVYDNNSKDNTFEIAQTTGAIVRRCEKQGKGNVIKQAFEEIDADVYVTIDGDDTYDFEKVPEMVNKVLNEGADMIVAEQKRLISGKSERLAENISKSRIYTTKRGRTGISAGYQPDAFEDDADGFNPGVVGMVHEFGRPGQSSRRSGDKMKQTRKRIPNKKTAKRKDWEEAVPTEVEISKGTIQPVPHIRRGFDNVREKAVNLVIDAVEKEVEKIGES